jgi:uncharacterized protein (DUF983 family)
VTTAKSSVDWIALLKQRCPRCREGRVFGGVLAMNATCPACGFGFEREQGYFLGAMYFSYAFGIAATAPLVVALLALTDLSLTSIGWTAGAELALLSPVIFRYSRVAWIHFDQRFDPR